MKLASSIHYANRNKWGGC